MPHYRVVVYKAKRVTCLLWPDAFQRSFKEQCRILYQHYQRERGPVLPG